MQNADHHTYPFGSVPKRLTDFFNAENRDFVGRSDELALTHQHLCEGQPTLLVRIGGIGKTTLACKYIELHWDDYRHIAWLTVTAPQSIGHNPHLAAADAGYSPLRDAFLRSPALWQSLGIQEQVEQRISGKDLEGAFQIVSQRGYESRDYLSQKVTRLHSTYALVSEPMDGKTWHRDALI